MPRRRRGETLKGEPPPFGIQAESRLSEMAVRLAALINIRTKALRQAVPQQ